MIYLVYKDLRNVVFELLKMEAVTGWNYTLCVRCYLGF